MRISTPPSNRTTTAYVPVQPREWSFAPPIKGPASDEAFRPYRRLATGVVARALLDLMNPSGSTTDRQSAQTFLAGSDMLIHWCRVAALDPGCIANRAKTLATERRLRPPPYCDEVAGPL